MHEGRQYAGMRYTGGQGCWNGPARSAKVVFSCGLEHKLLSVVEPSKCEYEMEFQTPAACSKEQEDEEALKHDEL